MSQFRIVYTSTFVLIIEGKHLGNFAHAAPA